MSCETELDFDAVFAPSLLDLWKAHGASFFFVFVFSFAFCESCTITGFEQIQTAYVNLLKVLGWTTDLSALHTKLLVSVSAVYAFVWDEPKVPAIWKNTCDFFPSAIICNVGLHKLKNKKYSTNSGPWGQTIQPLKLS